MLFCSAKLSTNPVIAINKIIRAHYISLLNIRDGK